MDSSKFDGEGRFWRIHFIALSLSLLTLILCGCSSPASKALSARDSEALADRTHPSQESLIRIAAAEYVVRDLLHLPADFAIFVELTDTERRTLASRLSQYRILAASQLKYSRRSGVRERKTGAEGGLINVSWIAINGDQASARVAFDTYGETLYRFELKNDNEWRVVNATIIGHGD